MAAEKLFKTFSESLINDLSISSNRTYYYFDDNNKVALKEELVDKAGLSLEFYLTDSKNKWADDRYKADLFLNIKISIKNIFKIFYDPTERCCYKSTKLGLGLEWGSSGSKIKRCIKIGEFGSNIEKLDDVELIKNNIRVPNAFNNINFYWFIYIVEQSKKVEDDNDWYGNDSGLVLGKGLLFSIIAKGNGSIFPIEEQNKPNEPLWTIGVHYDDWMFDGFDVDSISILLNQAHPLFKYVSFDSPDYSEDIFKESISSAVTTLILAIIEKAKSDQSLNELSLNEEEQGSILSAIKYFENVLQFNVLSTPQKIAYSVKKFFDKVKIQ